MVLVATTAMATDINKIISDVKARVAPDKRTALWDVKTTKKGGKTVVVGTVSTRNLKQALDEALKDTGVAVKVKVMEDQQADGQRWGLVKLAVASLRCEGAHSAEMATQAVMGTPIKVLEKSGDWYRVMTPDNYISYIPSSSFVFKTDAQMSQWRQAHRVVVNVYDTRMVEAPESDATVSDLVLSCILVCKGQQGDWLAVQTPDGREGYVEKSAVIEFDAWKNQSFNADLLESTARRMMGSGYLWGGTSTKVTDCSGLMKICYLNNGIILQRDASQQALTGKKISNWHDCQLGDLLFFGNANTGRVTHVGMYLRDGKYIHCSGQVKINSLDPSASDYLYSPLSISRIQGMIGTEGITTVAAHPWFTENAQNVYIYFNPQ